MSVKWCSLALTCCLLAVSGPWGAEVEAAKILTISFVSSKSHKITYEPLLRELARRGHEVTALSPIESKEEKNFKNIISIPYEAMGKDGGPNVWDLKMKLPGSVFEVVNNPWIFLGNKFEKMCTEGYKLPQVQAVLKEKYDLVFFTPFFNECLYGLIYKLNTTTIIFNQQSVFNWISDNLGTPSPPSFVSGSFVGFTDRMSFGQRLWNFVKNSFDWGILHFYYFPKMERVYRKAFGDQSLPSITEIEKNVSIVLSSSQISYSRPRPLLPDIIEVGGMALVPAKPVAPKELDDFLSGAEHGFILFSMGSALTGSEMPDNYRKIFLNVFSKLKQRVIWKWETETMDDLPPNVKLSKWLPQQDVLGHKNIRLFLTHGGLGSTTESVYHGVPLVGIPMFGDQSSNLRRGAAQGFALPPLDFKQLTEEILLDAINTILNDPSYVKNAKRLSGIFRDQINKPLDRAVYWVEYVLRHKGAVHLRSAARDLNYIQYFSLDVIAVLLVLAYVSLKINIFILKALFRKCFGRKAEQGEMGRKKRQ